MAAAKLSVSFSLSYVSPALAAEATGEVGANEHSSNLRVRLISEWCACTQLSEVLGEGATAWQSTEEELLDESQPRRALKTCTFSVEVDLPDFGSRERLEHMHAAPGLYAVVLRQETRSLPTESPETPAATEQRLVPVSFVYCDCSRFLVEAGRIASTGQRVGPRVAPAVGEAPVDSALLPVPSLVVSVASALLPREMSTPLEPLMLEFSSLGGFPTTSSSSTLGGTLGGTLSTNAAPELGNVYIYGRLDLGGTTRIIHARPSQQAETWRGSDDVGPFVETSDAAGLAATTALTGMLNTANTASTEGGFKGADHYPLDCRVCCLPGLADLPRFKEALATSTFVIQLHAEDINARAFHARACDEYHAAVLEAAASAGAVPAAAAPAAKAPAKGAPAAAVPASPALAQPAAFTPADSFLLAQVSRALQVGSEIQAHGTGRLRLEHLLEQSSDLLAEFRRRRAGLQEEAAAGTGPGAEGLSSLPVEEDVVVREDVLAEIRLAKPSKPLKWHLPAGTCVSCREFVCGMCVCLCVCMRIYTREFMSRRSSAH